MSSDAWGGAIVGEALRQLKSEVVTTDLECLDSPGYCYTAFCATQDAYTCGTFERMRDYSVAGSPRTNEGRWACSFDRTIVIEASDLRDIVAWRVDAERSRRETGAAALTDEQARDYIERFVPANSLWVPALLAHPPARHGAPVPALWCRLGRDREPVEIAERPPVSPSAP